jgi:hypothetical protein
VKLKPFEESIRIALANSARKLLLDAARWYASQLHIPEQLIINEHPAQLLDGTACTVSIMVDIREVVPPSQDAGEVVTSLV